MSISDCKGIFEKIQNQRILVKYFLLLSYVMYIVEAELSHYVSEAPLVAPALAPRSRVHSGMAPASMNLPLPVILPLVGKPHKKHLSPPGPSSSQLGPAPSPEHGSFTTAGHPPSPHSSQLSKPLIKKNQSPGPSSNLLPPHFVGITPAQSNAGTLPPGLARPPLSSHVPDCCGPGTVLKRGTRVCHCVYPIQVELLLFNVSLTSNWSSEFLGELSSQLDLRLSQFEITNFYVVGLSGLNITLDIEPHTGISFSNSDVSAINSSLVQHKLHLASSLVSDYKLLNLTWFKPPVPTPAPTVGISPGAPLPRAYSPIAASSASNRGKHPNLVLILGICAGILIIVIATMVIIYSFASGQGKKTAPSKETGKPSTTDVVSRDGSLPHPTSTRFLAYEELKDATNNFEQASMLGEGGFGRVFKGVLSDGTPVAIKKLTSGGHQGDKEFLVEVEMLSMLHHRNLVKLVGYYSSHDSSQNLLCCLFRMVAWRPGSMDP